MVRQVAAVYRSAARADGIEEHAIRRELAHLAVQGNQVEGNIYPQGGEKGPEGSVASKNVDNAMSAVYGAPASATSRTKARISVQPR